MFNPRPKRELCPFPVRHHRGHGQDHNHDHHHDHSHDFGHTHDPLDGVVQAAATGVAQPKSPLAQPQAQNTPPQSSTEGDKVRVMASIFDDNDLLAATTSAKLKQSGIFSINVMGAPGVGKTSSIIALTRELMDWNHYVVEGDIESDIDTQTLQKLGVETLQINTHGACHLDSYQIAKAIHDFEFKGPGLLLIENIGNLVCPAEMVIGEHCKLLIVTATDGSDKPYKYPLAFEKADLILLNKADLLPYVDFDYDFFMAGVRALNPMVEVLAVNARKGEGFAAAANWIRNRAAQVLAEA
jgi:hydrogenase nickel incorporation protein HypB